MSLDGLMGFSCFLAKYCFYLLVSLSICNFHQQTIGANESLWIWIGDCVKDTGHNDGIKLFNNSPTACFQYCGESATRIGLQGENCNCKIVINSIKFKRYCMVQCLGSDIAKCGNPAEGTWSVYERANINDIQDKNLPLNGTGCATVRFEGSSADSVVSYQLNNCTSKLGGSLCRGVKRQLQRPHCDGQTSNWLTACMNSYERFVSDFGDIKQARDDGYCTALQEFWIGLFALEVNVIELPSSTIEASFSTAGSQITESPGMSTAVQQSNESTFTDVIFPSSDMTFKTSDYESSTSYPSISSTLVEFPSSAEPFYLGLLSSLYSRLSESTSTSSIKTFTPHVSPSQSTKGFNAFTSTSLITAFTPKVSPSQSTKGFNAFTSTSSITTFTPQLSPSQSTKGFDASTSTNSKTTFTTPVTSSQSTKGFDASTSTISITTFTPQLSASQSTKGFNESTSTSSITTFTPHVSPSQSTKGFDASTSTSLITTFTPHVSPSQSTKGFDASTSTSSITTFTPHVSPSQSTKSFEASTSSSLTISFSSKFFSTQQSSLSSVTTTPTHVITTTAFNNTPITIPIPPLTIAETDVRTTTSPLTIAETDVHTTTLPPTIAETDVHTTTSSPTIAESDVHTTTLPPTIAETDEHTTTSSPTATEREYVHTTSSPLITEIKALEGAVIGVGGVAFLAVIAVCVLFIYMKRTISNMKKEMWRKALPVESRDCYWRRRSTFTRRDDASERVSSTRHGNCRQPNIMFSGSRRANLRSNYYMSSLDHGTRERALDNDYGMY